jgi:hypothetical protein
MALPEFQPSRIPHDAFPLTNNAVLSFCYTAGSPDASHSSFSLMPRLPRRSGQLILIQPELHDRGSVRHGLSVGLSLESYRLLEENHNRLEG